MVQIKLAQKRQAVLLMINAANYTMSCCCACPGSKWCASFGCPGLNKDKNLQHAGVEYSPVPSINPSSSAAAGTPILAMGDLNHPGALPNPAMMMRHSYSLVQPAGSRFSFPPQMGLSSDNEPVTAQPVGEGGASMNKNAVIQFFLHHDVMHSKLTVHLQCASNLPGKYDRNGLLQCDTFVTLHLEPDRGDKLRSKPVEGTCDPVFDERFLFGGFSMDKLKRQTLVLQVYNSAVTNRVIGEASLPLSEVELFGVVMQMLLHTKEAKVN